jgi:hypothetical protein
MIKAKSVCIICNEPVAPGEGGNAIGPFPALHSKCLRRAHDEAGGAVPSARLDDAGNELLAVRRALGRAVNGVPAEAVLAGVALLVCDVLAFTRATRAEEPEAAALILQMAREIAGHLSAEIEAVS